MRVTNEHTIPEELVQRVAELSALVAELSHRLDSIEVSNDHAPHPHAETKIYEADEWSNPIEFLTENGFVIVRPWETDGSTPPADGRLRFAITDPNGNEQRVDVNISRRLMSETAIQTEGRIGLANSFWICCAERRLANYLAEHDCFPKANEMAIDELEREDLLLTIRWGKSD